MSNYLFTYQHTCAKGVKAYILHTSAFKSTIKKKENGKLYIPFLGEGFYYWEENIDAAHSWGKRHYENEYNVVEYIDSVISRDETLDFLNRRDLKYFKELIEIYKNKRPESKKWFIANWIEFLKKLQKINQEKFPYIYFRADENHPDIRINDEMKAKTDFNYSGYYTFLDPLIILCAVNKCNLNSRSKIISF